MKCYEIKQISMNWFGIWDNARRDGRHRIDQHGHQGLRRDARLLIERQ